MHAGFSFKILVVAIFGTLLSSALLAASALTEHSTRAQARDVRRAVLTDSLRATELISVLDVKVRKARIAIEKLETALPREDQLPGITADLAKLLEVNSLDSQPIRCLRADCVEPLGEEILNFGVTGDFNGFYSFLLQLEQLPYAIRICSMKLTPLPNRDGDLQAQVSLKVTFRMIPATAAHHPLH